MKALKLLGTTALGVVVVALAGTAAAGPTRPTGENASSLVRIRLADDPNSLDPATMSNGAAYQLAQFTYNTLVTFRAGQIVPMLAEKWIATPQAITFTLKRGITCSNGTKLTASMVQQSVQRAVDPATKSTLAQQYIGAGATFSSNNSRRTFTVRVPKPNSDLLANFATPPLSIICPAGLADPEALQRQSFGTGPYVLTSAVRGSGYTLRLRPSYAWGPNGATAKGLPARVQLQVLADDTTATNVFLTGGLDITFARSDSSAQRLLDRGYVQRGYTNHINFVAFNMGRGRPTADRTVRRAVIQALDPKVYAGAAAGSLGVPSKGNLFPTTTTCASTDGASLRPPFDTSAARRTLESDGWRRGSNGVYEKGGEQLQLSILGNDAGGNAPAYVAQTLQDLGVKAQLRVVPISQGVAPYGRNDWDVLTGTLLAPITPSILSIVFGGGLDWGQIRDSDFSAGVARAATASDAKGVCAGWRQAQNALIGKLLVVPMAFTNRAAFGNKVAFTIAFSGLIDPTSIRLLKGK
ncbi:MAG: peptide ABC transporter substrate-binding protein [Gaiellaceae bacterium]|nr:MAG: peptide ABC transporter substrate-binding protein [Gaiellaceae bacterium]